MGEELVKKTRIKLRKDTEENWLSVDPVLLNGEVAVVDTDDGVKIKVGDGTSKFSVLNYLSTDVNEDTFIFEDDLVTNYTIGKYDGTLTNPKTISAKGKSFKEVWSDIFKNVVAGTITSNPSATLTCASAGAYEVGTVKTMSYSSSLSAGSYSYGPETGVTAKSYQITFNGDTLTTSSGAFDDYTVEQGSKTMSLSISYDDAPNKANKSDGSLDENGVYIQAGTKTDSKTVRGYRKMFYGTRTDKNALTSEIIRALSGAEVKTGDKDVSIPVGAFRTIFAVPETNSVSSVKDKNGMGAEIFSSFSNLELDVYGANNYQAIAYNVYYLDYANAIDKANTYTFKVV